MLGWLRNLGSKAYWLLGLSANVHWLYTLGLGVVVTAIASSILSFVQQMPAALFWLLALGIFILSFAGMNHGIGAYRRWRTPGIQPQPEELKRLCLHLSEELDEFIARRQAFSESLRFWQEGQKAETEEERARLKVEEWRAMPRDRALTLKLYRDRFRERVMAVYDVLARRGWLGPDQRHYFDNPENATHIQQVARILEDIGRKL